MAWHFFNLRGFLKDLVMCLWNFPPLFAFWNQACLISTQCLTSSSQFHVFKWLAQSWEHSRINSYHTKAQHPILVKITRHWAVTWVRILKSLSVCSHGQEAQCTTWEFGSPLYIDWGSKESQKWRIRRVCLKSCWRSVLGCTLHSSSFPFYFHAFLIWSQSLFSTIFVSFIYVIS